MHILENVGPKLHILFSITLSSEFLTIWVVTRGEGASKIGIFTMKYVLYKYAKNSSVLFSEKLSL